MKKIILFLLLLPLILFSVQDISNDVKFEIIRVDTNTNFPKIDVYLRILKKDGTPLTGLTKEHIKMLFQGAQTDFSFEEKKKVKSVSALILIDASGSLNNANREHIKATVKSFLKKMRASDDAAIMAFHDNVINLQSFTTDKKKLLQSVDRLAAGGTLTRIYNALHEGIDHLTQKAKHQKKVIIIISDGLDEGSTIPLMTVVNKAKENNIPIYSMGFTNIGANFFRSLETLSNLTGGIFSRENSIDLAGRILTIEKSLYKITFTIHKGKPVNEVSILDNNNNIRTKYSFTLTQKQIKELENIKKRKKLYIILAIAIPLLLLILLLLLSFIKKKKAGAFTKSEYLLLSRTVLEDISVCDKTTKEIYKKALLNGKLSYDDFKSFTNRIIKNLENKNLDEKDKQTFLLLKDSLNSLLKSKSHSYNVNNFFVEPYKTKILFFLDGKIAPLTDIERKAFSEIVFSDIDRKMKSDDLSKLSLNEYDFFNNLTFKTSYDISKLKDFIKYIFNAKDNVDKNIWDMAYLGILTLENLIANSKSKKECETGQILIDPYIQKIKNLLKKYDDHLKQSEKQLTSAEKSALGFLAANHLKEHKEYLDFYSNLVNLDLVPKVDIEKLYKLLSNELMFTDINNKEKSIDCSALYKLAFVEKCEKEGCPRTDFLSGKGFKELIKTIKQLKSKPIDPEKEKEIDELINLFEEDNKSYTQKNKEKLFDIGEEIDLDVIIDAFLVRAYVSGVEGFDVNEIMQNLSILNPELLAKLIPYMIQLIKDSEGNEQQANLNILKNIAQSLQIDISAIADIDAWSDWWKNNKKNIMEEISDLKMKKDDRKTFMGFSLHEDIVFYTLYDGKLTEITAKIIGIEEETINLLIHDKLNLEQIVAVYAREENVEICMRAAYAFLRTMWIAEIEENIYETGINFLKRSEKKYSEELANILSGE